MRQDGAGRRRPESGILMHKPGQYRPKSLDTGFPRYDGGDQVDVAFALALVQPSLGRPRSAEIPMASSIRQVMAR